MAAGSEQQYAYQRQRAAPGRQKGPTSPFDKTVHCHAVLLNCVFQSFTRNKCRYVCCGDFDFITGLRVAASTLSAVVHFEGTETNQLYSIAFLSLQCVYRLLSIECDGNA